MRHALWDLKIPVQSAALLAAFAVLVTSVARSSEAYEPEAAIRRFSDTFDVNADGTYRKVSEAEFRIETSEGISLFGVERVPYAGSRETLEVREAWVVQPDGSKIVIPPESIRTQEEGAEGGSTDFSDTKYKVIVFPQVRVGSRLYWKTESIVHAPLFKGQFWTDYVLSPHFSVADWQVVINVPVGMPLYIEKRGVTGGLESHSASADHYRFSYKRPTFLTPEEVAVSTADYADLLRVSTLPDAVAFGKLFHEGAAPKVAETEELRSLAARLTEGLTDERQKAKALYIWVAKSIRYVSLSLGSGGFVPHPAAEVLAHEYGDCKDHTILLEALLRAVGIESVPALINGGGAYTLATVGVSSPLDHVITYLPTLDLYVDSTDKFAPFGTLPFGDSDKPVVLTSSGRLGRTPRAPAKNNLLRTDVSMVIQSDGSIDGSSMATMTGQYELSSRWARFGDRGMPSDQIVKGILSRFGETGSGTISHPDPEDIAASYWVQGHFRLDPVSNVPGLGALRIPVGLAPGNLAGMAETKPVGEQQHSWSCMSRTVLEHYTIQFPENVQVTAIPKPMSYRDDQVTYRSSYSRFGRNVVVERSLVIDRPSQVCTIQDRQNWRALNSVLQRDLRSQVFYR